MWYVFSPTTICSKSMSHPLFKRVWESIAVPQPQNADNTWHSVVFLWRTLFFAIAWKKVLKYFLSAQILLWVVFFWFTAVSYLIVHTAGLWVKLHLLAFAFWYIYNMFFYILYRYSRSVLHVLMIKWWNWWSFVLFVTGSLKCAWC